MFSRNRDEHHESGTTGGMIRWFTASSLCFSKEPRPDRDDRRRGINISGVDFWHAVEFSRNGRFLCTHPLGLSSGRFPSVLLCSCVSDSIRPFPDPISSALSRFPLSRFPFRRVRLYQILFRSVSGPNSIPAACGVAFAFRLIRLYQKHFGRSESGCLLEREKNRSARRGPRPVHERVEL